MICNTVRAFDTSKTPSFEDGAKYKPDIAFYDSAACDSEKLTCFQRMGMFVEFKCGNTSDPFYSGERMPFEKLFETTCVTRGQIILYSPHRSGLSSSTKASIL